MEQAKTLAYIAVLMRHFWFGAVSLDAADCVHRGMARDEVELILGPPDYEEKVKRTGDPYVAVWDAAGGDVGIYFQGGGRGVDGEPIICRRGLCDKILSKMRYNLFLDRD